MIGCDEEVPVDSSIGVGLLLFAITGLSAVAVAVAVAVVAVAVLNICCDLLTVLFCAVSST